MEFVYEKYPELKIKKEIKDRNKSKNEIAVTSDDTNEVIVE